jgi:hypothetical protein
MYLRIWLQNNVPVPSPHSMGFRRRKTSPERKDHLRSGSGMFYPGSQIQNRLIPDADSGPNIFSPRILHDKGNAKLLLFSCFLCFQEQSLSHSKEDPRSGRNSSRIQGVKKHRVPDPDQQHCLRQKSLKIKKKNKKLLLCTRYQYAIIF